jgi:hypothetical protein
LLDPGGLLVSADPSNIHRLSTADLRALVRAERSSKVGGAAVAELIARRPRGLTRLLTELALDDRADQGVRVNAVAGLGSSGARPSLEGLRAALLTNDESVERRAIERLGKIGTAEDLELLKSIRTGNRTTQRVLRSAKCFLSYRHRLGTYRVDELTAAAADVGVATPIRATTPTAKMLDRMELVAPSVPGISVAPTPVRRLVCGGGDFALMWSDEFTGAGAATIVERQGIPAVLLGFNYETGAYTPAYYFFTDPARGSRFRITGLRGSGRVGLVGRGELDDEELRFEVNATEAPIEHPLTVTGRYQLESGTVRFDDAVVEPRFSARQQRLRKQPRRERRPR